MPGGPRGPNSKVGSSMVRWGSRIHHFSVVKRQLKKKHIQQTKKKGHLTQQQPTNNPTQKSLGFFLGGVFTFWRSLELSPQRHSWGDVVWSHDSWQTVRSRPLKRVQIHWRKRWRKRHFLGHPNFLCYKFLPSLVWLLGFGFDIYNPQFDIVCFFLGFWSVESCFVWLNWLWTLGKIFFQAWKVNKSCFFVCQTSK